jgi:hypothetical protein
MRRLAGSDLNLTCTCLTTPEPPVAVVWLHVSNLAHFIVTCTLRQFDSFKTNQIYCVH